VTWTLRGILPIVVRSRLCRSIAATVLDLAEKVIEGRFREDLYKGLNIVTIELPPLREHKEDIPLLASHFIHRLARYYRRHITGLFPAAREFLLRYDWPSNVREPKQALERAIIAGQGEYILPEDLPGSCCKTTRSRIKIGLT
jgi:DNA-binding NtrC family response regulator